MFTKNTKKTYKPEYLEDWPVHFYELTDAPVRLQCIKEYMKAHPDAAEEKRRFEIFNHRYSSIISLQDNYYYGWVMLKSVSESSTFMNRTRRENDLRRYFIDLGVLSENCDEYQLKEWENFANDFVRKSIRGNSYGKQFMGLGHVSDHDKAIRLANDINTVLAVLPREIYLEKQAATLKNYFEKAFIKEVEEGEEILASIH